MSPGKIIDHKQLADVLLQAAKITLEEKYNARFSQDPIVAEREIIEYGSRIRTLGLDKFNDPCYVSSINLFSSQENLKQQKTSGAIIIYIEEVIGQDFLKAINKKADDDDEELVMKNCGEILKEIAAKFINSAQNFGYSNMVSSETINEKNDISGGVDFEYNETKLQEISFFIKKVKAVVISITLAPAP
ncbi:MAG: hypothetical protein HQL27_01755 [Candidatus Omnitrophica bacterium]|nr:hypothetical protein [Candidatus Omnitrophota bacterium]